MSEIEVEVELSSFEALFVCLEGLQPITLLFYTEILKSISSIISELTKMNQPSLYKKSKQQAKRLARMLSVHGKCSKGQTLESAMLEEAPVNLGRRRRGQSRKTIQLMPKCSKWIHRNQSTSSYLSLEIDEIDYDDYKFKKKMQIRYYKCSGKNYTGNTVHFKKRLLNRYVATQQGLSNPFI